MRRTGKRATVPATATEGAGGGSNTNSLILGPSIFGLSVAPVLAPKIQLLLDRPVGIAEQHRLLRCLVRHLFPARHDENVPRLPFEYLVPDLAAPATFDRHEHGCIRRPIQRRRESFGQELDEG